MTAPTTKPKRKRTRKVGDDYATRTIARDLDEPHAVDEIGEFLRCEINTRADVEGAVRGGLRSVGWEYVS